MDSYKFGGLALLAFLTGGCSLLAAAGGGLAETAALSVPGFVIASLAIFNMSVMLVKEQLALRKNAQDKDEGSV